MLSKQKNNARKSEGSSKKRLTFLKINEKWTLIIIYMPEFESIVYIYILSKPFPHKAWNKRRIDAVSNIQKQLTTIHFRWGQNGVNNWALGVFF